MSKPLAPICHLLALVMLSMVGGCRHVDLMPLEKDTDTEWGADVPAGMTALDILLVVDNSMSMDQEHALLNSQVEPLVIALTAEPTTADERAVEDIRIAVVSTDMGLQWGGNPYDNDGWPGTPPCSGTGDNGKFQPNQEWFETAADAPDIALPSQVVGALETLGTQGCGFEQQLEAARKAVHRDDQEDFVRDEALLALVFLSDEEDCSIEDGPSLFATDEIQDLGAGKVNVACSLHPDFLYDAASYWERYAKVKDGQLGAILMLMIVGVPIGDDCEGEGDDLASCLDHPQMQNDLQLEGDPPSTFVAPACTRDDSEAEVTRARPGRRFVELAQEVGWGAYVFSICNPDWSPAISHLTTTIRQNIAPD